MPTDGGVGGSPPIPFIARRLALLSPSSHNKSAKSLRPAQTRRKLSKKWIGALKAFIGLPLDVTYEIVIHLDPTDLLNLSRLSKDFRETFMSRSSITIWKRILRQVEGLPLCPYDISEPEYVSLMYDKFCMACGSYRGRIHTMFTIRLRLCVACTNSNLMKGHKLGRLADTMQDIFQLVPSAESTKWFYPPNYEPNARLFFKPEIESMLKELMKWQREKKDRPEVYQAFISNQRSNALRMMQEGRAMQSWKKEVARIHREVVDKIVDDRRERLFDEMHSLGWETRYLPASWADDDSGEWLDYLNQEKAFTRRSWNLARPRLEVIYNKTKSVRQREHLLGFKI